EFYSRFADLVERTTEALDQGGAFESDVRNEVKRLRRAQELMRLVLARKKDMKSLTDDEKQMLNGLYGLNKLGDPLVRENSEAIEKSVRELEVYIEQADKGMVLVTDIGPQWRRLFDACKRLEILAHKQLRGVAFGRDERAFLNHYGITLANLMLYG